MHSINKLLCINNKNLKFLLRCRPHGFSPNGLSHSYIATATAVTLREVKIAIHNSGEKGNKNASRGISVLCLGAARNETPLKKYGTEKSITCDL